MTCYMQGVDVSQQENDNTNFFDWKVADTYGTLLYLPEICP